jgi:hypothetical protein
LAPWELQIGDLRVFYAVESEPGASSADEEAPSGGRVFILGVGIKRGNRLLVGNEEWDEWHPLKK